MVHVDETKTSWRVWPLPPNDLGDLGQVIELLSFSYYPSKLALLLPPALLASFQDENAFTCYIILEV